MAAETPQDATSYIQHHLTFFAEPVAESGGFWTLHYDTIITSFVLGVLVLGFVWLVVRKASSGVPSRAQAFAELLVEFVNSQVRSMFHHDYRIVAPIALTVGLWVLFMNLMDLLPVDLMSWVYANVFHLHAWRQVATADVNTTFALSLSVLGLMIYYSIRIKGMGGWLHELYGSPFGMRPLWAAPLLILFNLLFNAIEYISRPLSHSLRLFGNMYAGEIMFLLIAVFAASGYLGVFFGSVFQASWILFDGFIAILQAYIFMMLTIAYIAMAHEHH
ncbi:MAG TPA: F0F1 ATP synthase subunit A [Casimicrobiaceae bacterium]|nr:F0F1 ATP synthase subunit A [Casimicrobiaceae bacterium]